MADWFTIEKIDSNTFAISEYKHFEEVHSYLLIGARAAKNGLKQGSGIFDFGKFQIHI